MPRGTSQGSLCYVQVPVCIIIVIIASLVVGFIAAPYAEEATKQEVTHTEIPTSTQQQKPVTK